jgi:hypothetical protein
MDATTGGTPLKECLENQLKDNLLALSSENEQLKHILECVFYSVNIINKSRANPINMINAFSEIFKFEDEYKALKEAIK